ncbi:hypothetical protein [Geminocystis sp. GBBB08]|uniref:hypothetical protein n=1 Tax=Geminocystis sp. GBBB08 TaxID=2604140 RepID=UPI0027E2534A|nr:hypothetical protein [Geminocystis sp. GBBB08]MBL1209194.1 hypothetical protein [Geminocystis sp. GBBB08]
MVTFNLFLGASPYKVTENVKMLAFIHDNLFDDSVSSFHDLTMDMCSYLLSQIDDHISENGLTKYQTEKG